MPKTISKSKEPRSKIYVDIFSDQDRVLNFKAINGISETNRYEKARLRMISVLEWLKSGVKNSTCKILYAGMFAIISGKEAINKAFAGVGSP